MACSDFRYSKEYSNKPPNTGVFLTKTEISATETVPYSFRKVLQAFQPGSRCNQTSSIRWHVPILDISKCIPIKFQILRFYHRKQRFPLLKPSHIRSERCSNRSIPVADVTRRALSDGTLRFSIFESVFQQNPKYWGFSTENRDFLYLNRSIFVQQGITSVRAWFHV